MKKTLIALTMLTLTLPSFAGVVSEAKAKTAKENHERHVKQAQTLLAEQADLEAKLQKIKHNLELLDQDKDMEPECVQSPLLWVSSSGTLVTTGQ